MNRRHIKEKQKESSQVLSYCCEGIIFVIMTCSYYFCSKIELQIIKIDTQENEKDYIGYNVRIALCMY